MSNIPKGTEDKVHANPPLCFISDGTYGDLVRCSTRDDEVTCPLCFYYLFHPEAGELERKFRMSFPHNNIPED